ncbi:hypothetical protein QFZ22_003891 [Streptomyces canus]|uniref:Integrase n=1 Tax=Streptomyces canus TaxID=58343 RepID=A0AAW8FCQ5_9ACTN|nr:hypothetical protein [Streptomyces canus]MDQ0907906.1 hypothetical protein [Streptomyces canus]
MSVRTLRRRIAASPTCSAPDVDVEGENLRRRLASRTDPNQDPDKDKQLIHG